MGYIDSQAWKKLIEIVADSLSDSIRFAEIYKVDRMNAEKAIRTFTSIKDMAALGSKSARQSIVDYYIRLLEAYKQEELEEMINKVVDFKAIQNNEPEIVFELLLANFSFEEIWDNYREFTEDLSSVEGDLLVKVGEKMSRETNFMKKYEAKREKLNFICILLYAVSYGQSCIEALQYKDINEIGILNKNYIYIIHKGAKIHLKFLKFGNSGTIINIQKKTTQKSALNYDMQNPMLVTAKNNSNRISVAGYDVTPGDDDLYYNERIFNLSIVSLEDIRDKYKTVDNRIVEFLKFNQRGRGSFIVSGSDMGVGKSTFLLSMIGEYPNSWGIGILDQQNELQIGVKYPEKNVITLVENSKRNLAQCFAYLLKTSRDVLVVSEITLPEEVSELVNSALRLNAGVSATMHSFSPKEVIPNLRNLMMKTPMYHDKNTAEEDISNCIDLIIHLKRLKSGRIVVDSIHEVFSDASWRDEYVKKDLSIKGKQQKDSLMMEFMDLGIKYFSSLMAGKQYMLKTLFKYKENAEEEGSEWEISEAPSEHYLNKMSRYAGEDYTEEIRKMFKGV